MILGKSRDEDGAFIAVAEHGVEASRLLAAEIST
jgi:hypothetical protein